MFKKQRVTIATLGAVGVLALVAPGLTAGIEVPTGADAPAAGQGVVQLQGFEVDAINWEISGDGDVTEVTFTIVRDGGATAADVDANEDEDSGNAVVRVRLENTDTTPATVGDWQSCDVIKGQATCSLAGGAQMAAEDLDQVNIIAFDRN